jgi:hypothetical protein
MATCGARPPPPGASFFRPAAAGRKIERLPVHIQQDVHILLAIEAGDSEGQCPGVRVVPARIVQLAAMPGDVLQAALIALACEETLAAQTGVAPAEADQPLPEAEQAGVLLSSQLISLS